MPCVPASFLEVSYLTCCVFFLPFFTISGESSHQVTQMEERKSGRGPRKATPRSRRIFTGSWIPSLFFLYASNTPVTNVPGPSSTSMDPKFPPPAPAAVFFTTLSLYLIFGFSLQLLSRNRESMGKHHEKSGFKWLSDLYFLASLTLVPSCPFAVFDFFHKHERE